MRIAYISADPGVPVFGRKGSSVHVQEVIRAMRSHGAQVDLYTTRTGGDPPADLHDVEVHQLPALPKGDIEVRERAAMELNADLRSRLEANGDLDLIYERYSLWSMAGMRYASSAGVPSVLEVNSPLVEEQSRYRGLGNRESAEICARTVFNLATTVVTVSESVADYVRTFTSTPERVHVFPNGINPDRFPSRIEPALPAPTCEFTIGFVGTLKPWHGLPVLIDAFEQVYRTDQRTRLLIVGDGDERERLQEDVDARELGSATHFTGAVDPTEIPGLLASMDIATAPYPDHPDFYFSPLKLFEYMAAGLPCIASDIGQISTVVEDGVTGFLCSPGNADELAALFERLRRNSNLRAQVGRNARSYVLANHTWNSIVTQILDIASVSAVAKQGV